MTKTLMLAALVVSTAYVAGARDPAGGRQGTLTTGAGTRL